MKLRDKILANWGLKLGSLVVACFLWLLVTNINDPIAPLRFYNVPVKIKNPEVITNQGEIYEVLDNTDTLDVVTIMAPRSVIDSLSADNVMATADMNDLTSLDTITIKLSTNKYADSIQSINGSHESIKLNIENKKTVTLALKPSITGELDSGYMVGEVTTGQNLVRISGPESIVTNISKAVVNVDVTGFTSSINTTADIKLLDEEGNEVTASNLSKNISMVDVDIDILRTMVVPVLYEAEGKPSNGYALTGQVDISPSEVMIAGKAKDLSEVTAIIIPSDEISVADATDNVISVVDLDDYMPNGVMIANSEFNGETIVTVFVEEEAAKDFQIPNSNIEITGVPDGYSVSLTDKEGTTKVTVIGRKSLVDELNGSMLSPTVDLVALLDSGDLEEMKEGVIEVSVNIGVSKDYRISHEEKLKLTVKKKD